MSRQEDLERNIRESYDIIRQHEEIVQTSNRPEEKVRSRRSIGAQWELIRGYFTQYKMLCQRMGIAMAIDICEIVTHFQDEVRTDAISMVPPASPSSQSNDMFFNRRGDTILDGSNSPTGPVCNRWALLVGVNTFIDPAFPLLKYCVRDVLALQVTLEAAGYTVIALHDDAAAEHLWPTRDNIEAELTRICEAAGPDDLIWVHFSCHGKLIAGRPLLVTREIRVPTMAKKALSLAGVEAMMRESKCRRRVLTLDACHTGVEIGRDLADPEFIRNVYELAEGFALLAASTSQQIAQEWNEKEHGVFTYFLLKGLRREAPHASKGFVTVNDLALQALDGLRRWNVIHGGILQEPTARIEGLGDMILIDFRGFDDE